MTRPKKIILIVIDTLRADHLGCYGYKRKTSPNIDELCKEGIIFRHAFSPSPYTVPSHASIFTSKYPSNHTIGFNQDYGRLDSDCDITLAEVMNNLNYKTAAFVSSPVLRKEINLCAGFEEYDDEIASYKRDGEQTTNRALSWLEENKDNDFFLFVHYFDVHGPYINPEPFNKIFVNDEYYEPPETQLNMLSHHHGVGGLPRYQILNQERDSEGKLINYEKDPRYYRAQYDGGIKYCDGILGSFFNKLKDMNIYEDTLLIITSDHGESLGENNVFFIHGLSVTLDQIHVPLIVKPHKGWGTINRVIELQVSTIDIMPSILALCDYEYNELNLDGIEFVKFIEGDKKLKSQRMILSENELQYAIICPNKLMELHKKVDPTFTCLIHHEPDLVKSLDNTRYRWDSGKEYVLDDTDVKLYFENRYLPFTNPQMLGKEIHHQHLNRYAFASQFVKGKTVLVLASGEGYGCYILSKEAIHVTGLDIEIDAVERANAKYIRDSLEFVQGSIFNIPSAVRNLFDIVVCFDVIKDINDLKKVMQEIKSLLKKDGMFIISLHNKQISDRKRGDEFCLWNPYMHEFRAFLDIHFPNVYYFWQGLSAGANIWPVLSEDEMDCSEFDVEKSQKKFVYQGIADKTHIIALASNNIEPNRNIYSYFINISNNIINQRDKQISELGMQLKSFMERVLAQDYATFERDIEVSGFKTKLQEAINKTQSFEGILSERDIEVSGFKTKLQEAINKTQSFEGILSERDIEVSGFKTKLQEAINKTQSLEGILSERDIEVSGFKTKLQEAIDKTQSLEGILSERDIEVSGFKTRLQEAIDKTQSLEGILSERDNQIAMMQQSITWRLVMAFHEGLIEPFMPQNTKRRRIYDMGIQGGKIIANEGWAAFWKKAIRSRSR